MPKIAIYSGYPLAGMEKLNYESYRQSIGFNSGNIIFKVGSSLISCEDLDEVDYISLDPKEIERYNETYDYVLFAGANLINPNLRHVNHAVLASRIEKLKIPFIPLSLGSQGPFDYDPNLYKRLPDSIDRFVRVLADSCEVVGVRGEYTADQLHRMGIENVRAVGCPSIFSKGIGLLQYNYIVGNEAVACNITPSKSVAARRFAHDILNEAVRHGYNLVEQSIRLAPKLLYFQNELSSRDLDDFSREIAKLYERKRLWYFSSYATWLSFLENHSFSFGIRIHGNIAAALVGTPCHILAPDSRVREIAELMKLPFSNIRDVQKFRRGGPICDYLLERTDMTAFKQEFSKRLKAYADFMDANGVRHNLDAELRLKTNYAVNLHPNPEELGVYHLTDLHANGLDRFAEITKPAAGFTSFLRWKAIDLASFMVRSASRWTPG